MAYNYGAPPGAFGRQPGYGFPGAPSAAPGMAPPPGFDAPPGMTVQTPTGQPPFQVPNIPGVNLNASVIRLGVDQKAGSPADRIAGGRNDGPRGSNSEPFGGRGRPGLGAEGSSRNIERDRAMVRENMLAVQPPTREELARTIFVGGIGEDAPDDEALEDILRCAGKLRRWTRARDADDKKCKFGFAEYEDVDSLEAANEIFGDGIEVPAFKGGKVKREGDDNDFKKVNLLVVVDEQSQKYIEEWTSKRKEGDDARQFRLDGCKEDLRQCIASMTNADAFAANAAVNGDADGDVRMGETNGDSYNGDGKEAIVSIPLGGPDDELGDIPEEMRATVAAEIKAFRERSTRRDLERMKKEEEMEQQERQRALGARASRLASPTRGGVPSGPTSSTNGIPLGPRDRVTGPAGAPSGPKGFRGAQMPSDYANGVPFVGANGPANGFLIKREDEDAEESDEELEARRLRQHEEELEKQYLEQERRWLNRERHSGGARQRDRQAEKEATEKKEKEKEALAKRLREWNDNEESRLGREEYYIDRSAWLRKRATYRDTEQRMDDANRSKEMREHSAKEARDTRTRDQADAFLDEMSEQMAAKNAAAPSTGPAGNFKLSLGSAAARTKASAAAAPAPKKALPDVEGLLEDEEDAAASGHKKPELKPLSDTSTLPINGADLTDEERAVARQQLAGEIPSDIDALFAHPVRWASLTSNMIEVQVRPMVEKKVVEYLGVQEELLVDTVVDGIKNHRSPEELAQELEPALEEEAKVLMKKVWRLVVFVSESESRGLN